MAGMLATDWTHHWRTANRSSTWIVEKEKASREELARLCRAHLPPRIARVLILGCGLESPKAMTWCAVGTAIGNVSRQRAHQLAVIGRRELRRILYSPQRSA